MTTKRFGIMYMRIWQHKNQKGFTLVEMIIAVFIFLMVILALVTLFAAQMRAYIHARSGQKDLENAQFALNYLGKSLRTATLVGAGKTSLLSMQIQEAGGDYWNYQWNLSGSSNALVFYDFSQDLCMRLFVQDRVDGLGRALFLQEVANDPSDNDSETPVVAWDRVQNCMRTDIYQLSATGKNQYRETRLTSGDVEAFVSAAPTRSTDLLRGRQTNTIGRATIALRVWPLNHKEDATPMYIQTTTSLRDYPRDMSY